MQRRRRLPRGAGVSTDPSPRNRALPLPSDVSVAAGPLPERWHLRDNLARRCAHILGVLAGWQRSVSAALSQRLRVRPRDVLRGRWLADHAALLRRRLLNDCGLPSRLLLPPRWPPEGMHAPLRARGPMPVGRRMHPGSLHRAQLVRRPPRRNDRVRGGGQRLRHGRGPVPRWTSVRPLVDGATPLPPLRGDWLPSHWMPAGPGLLRDVRAEP